MPIASSESMTRRKGGEGRALDARRSGGVGAGKRRSGPSEALAARKDGRRTIGDGERRKVRRRRDQCYRGAASARTDAGACVVIVRRRVRRCMVAVACRGIGNRVMRVTGCGRRGCRRRCRGAAAVHCARPHDARFPDNQREPDGETGRQRAKPRGPSHA